MGERTSFSDVASRDGDTLSQQTSRSWGRRSRIISAPVFRFVRLPFLIFQLLLTAGEDGKVLAVSRSR